MEYYPMQIHHKHQSKAKGKANWHRPHLIGSTKVKHFSAHQKQ
jgi:hypothetical protein